MMPDCEKKQLISKSLIFGVHPWGGGGGDDGGGRTLHHHQTPPHHAQGFHIPFGLPPHSDDEFHKFLLQMVEGSTRLSVQTLEHEKEAR